MKKYVSQILRFKQQASMKVFEKLCIASAFLVCNPVASFAMNLGEDNANISDWPWTKFFRSLADQLTGPLPLLIGIFGVVGAAGAMIYGNFGASVQKLLGLIAGVSICLFAPSFMHYLDGSITDSSGLLIFFGM